MSRKEVLRYAFVQSIPILCSYIFLGAAYGILMEEAGLHWYYSLLVSLVVYTGAFQFVLTTLLSAGTNLLTIAVTALFMNSRQLFYSISFVKDFNAMGKGRKSFCCNCRDCCESRVSFCLRTGSFHVAGIGLRFHITGCI